jgi:hypothetical protein
MKYALQINDKDLKNPNPKFKADVEFDDINEFNKHFSNIMSKRTFPCDIVFVTNIDDTNECCVAERVDGDSKFNPNEFIMASVRMIDKWKNK